MTRQRYEVEGYTYFFEWLSLGVPYNGILWDCHYWIFMPALSKQSHTYNKYFCCEVRTSADPEIMANLQPFYRFLM